MAPSISAVSSMEVAPVPFIGLLVVPKNKKQSQRRICSKYPGSIKLRHSGKEIRSSSS